MAGEVLLHEGGEACIYGLQENRTNLVLKKYKDGTSFDKAVLEKISNCKIEGLYRVREIGSRDGSPCIVYENVEGVASSKFEVLPVAVALQALRQVTKTLDELDRIDVHHGDLSPSNVILAPDGDSFKTVLIDFGIVGPGALSYAAPERFRGKVPDTKSDLFALGMLFYRWISGCDLIPAGEFEFEEFVAKMSQVDPQNLTDQLYGMGIFSAQDLSALEPIWSGLLERNPEDRFEDFDELDEILEIALAKVSGGEISLLKAIRDFAGGPLTEQTEKMRQNVPAFAQVPENSQFLQGSTSEVGKKFPVKVSVFVGVGLILLIVTAVLIFGTKNSDIDDVGSMVLQKSRSLESTSGMESQPVIESNDVQVDSSFLKDLPTPGTNP